MSPKRLIDQPRAAAPSTVIPNTTLNNTASCKKMETMSGVIAAETKAPTTGPSRRAAGRPAALQITENNADKATSAPHRAAAGQEAALRQAPLGGDLRGLTRV